ncbi:hypothetical protein ERO13_A05G277301v2 [Gossypium hirsutum]|nr:hypothetical protein ERO13_A05G277301v2 [Gossypium hirsutum]
MGCRFFSRMVQLLTGLTILGMSFLAFSQRLSCKSHAGLSLLETAKKLASQYQKEVDKCNSGMDTCEEGRKLKKHFIIMSYFIDIFIFNLVFIIYFSFDSKFLFLF